MEFISIKKMSTDTPTDINLETLPNEMLLKICQKMDTETLVTMSNTYKRVYQECYDIIQKRKEEYNQEKMAQEFNQAVKLEKRFYAHKVNDNGKAIIALIPFSTGLFLAQSVKPFKNRDLFPWPLPALKFNIVNDERQAAISGEELKELIDFLVREKYQLGTS